ncbi:MAG: hypothetical protein ACHQEA_11890 [Gaiellales bacterium]
MAVVDRPISRTRRVARPTWARTIAAATLAVVVGPAAAAAVLLVVWSLLHAAGVTPSQSIGETALLDTLPGSNVLWDILGGVVFAGLVVLDALVRVRCVRAVAAVRLPSGWAVVSVLVAPGGWAWLDDRLEALPIMAASIGLMSLIIRGFARPSTTWRPTQRGWLAIGGLAAAGLAGLWVTMGAPLVQANGAASEVRIVPQGVYDTDRPLHFKELVFGRQKPMVAIFRVTVNNAGLLPIHVTEVTPDVSGGLFRPVDVPAGADLDRGDSVTLATRARIRSCWPLPSHQISSVDAVLVTYTVLGVERTQRLAPDDPLRVVCPKKA